MKKNHQIKRKHHHIWSYYLKQWSLNDRDVHYTTKKNNIACDSVHGIACEIDFYKINLLNQDDITFIRGFSSKGNDGLQEVHEGFLSDFAKMSQMASFQNHPTFPEELKKLVKTFEYNPLEDLHASFENSARPILQRLNQGELPVLDDRENMTVFMAYIGQQIGRSKAIKDNVFKVCLNPDRFPENAPYEYEQFANLFEWNWWFLSFMFGINIGASLNVTRSTDNHVFLINNTKEPFITTDNPIINIHDSLSKLSPFEPPAESDFYYPLSPNYAYMINNSTKYGQGEREVTETEARELNLKLAKKHNHHLIAQTKEQLMEIRKLNR